MTAARPIRIAVLGAGAGGLCAAIQLDRHGFHDVTVFEQSDGVGGTWRHNTYPGAACDIPSLLYCFSFARKRDWSTRFANQAEILEYFEHLTDRFGLRPKIRFESTVRSAVFDEQACAWDLTVASPDGSERTERFDVVISALGQLNRPYVPDLEGASTFSGPQFHSARWNHDVDLTGQRVGVVGNAASAIQLIPPVAERAAHLTVFQRSANWIVPKPGDNTPGWRRALIRRVPGLALLVRWSTYWRLEAMYYGVIRHGGWLARLIRRRAPVELAKISSESLPIEALVPDVDPGCTRLLLSDNYYATLLRPNVSVVTSHLRRVLPDGVETEDGCHHPLDVLVFATGFRSTEFLVPLEVVGRGGTRLHDEWAQGAQAHLGIAMPGFPNLFLVYGPNTNLGHNSILFMIEAQVRWVIQALGELRDHDLGWVEADRRAMDRYSAQLDRDLATTVWGQACRSWYKTASGRVTNNWPSTATGYWRRTRRLDPTELRRGARV